MYACICEKLKLKIRNSQQNGTYGRIRIRKVSKHILDTINKYILHAKVNQWRNSASVIEWFKAMKTNNAHCF